MVDVLVVDDDEDIRESLCALLEDEGHRVAQAANGMEALGYLRENLPALPCVILLDLMMPVMDGATFRAEQLRDPALREIPVVVITAAGPQAIARLSATHIVRKPLKIESVLEAIARHCGNRPATSGAG